MILFVLIFLASLPTISFEKQVIDPSISIGYGVALGDVDGDRKPDILLADKKQFVWYRNGDWKRFVMADSLTEFDNVCIAASDVDGDGRVEVAVGAQWNPGETTDAAKSGSVHYLVRPEDPTTRWTPMRLHHEPTVHRMRWVQHKGKFYLVVVPLHGRSNQNGQGPGVKILAYPFPFGDPPLLLDSSMHLTHNFEVNKIDEHKLYVAGKEGIRVINFSQPMAKPVKGLFFPAGEVRSGIAANKPFLVTIEPMHGTQLVLYTDGNRLRHVLDSNLREGHAIATADFDLDGNDEIVAGWRSRNNEGKTGIKIYSTSGRSQWIDSMACEDLQVMDLNLDGRPDVVAAGRATRDLAIFWNTSPGEKK